ncbi:Ig-like domain repeat protein [Streptomyces sp. TP-A0356]|uniref:Ig-like domain repeat protein n=1 Tax=Streptomyces sp. TP-A0356 TaxID=1359208 RepID=UPI000B3401A9
MRTLTAATTLAVLFSSAALAAAPAFADSSRILPVTSTGDIVVDGVHQRVFVSDPNDGKIVVTDYSGTVVKEVTNLPGVTGLELSADSGTLYAAVRDADAIAAIDTATDTESARYPVGHGPLSVALAGGKLWFGYGAAAQGNLGSLDLSGGQPVVALDLDRSWYSAPILDAAPGSNTLVAGAVGQSPVELASYDVSSGTVTRLASTRDAGSNLGDIKVTPDGQDVIVASGAPYYQQVFKTSDLTADGKYPTNPYPNAVAVAPDGTVAGGTFSWYDPDVHVFKPHTTTPVRQYDFPNTGNTSGSDTLAPRGLAWAPDESRLFAVSENSQGVYSLRVLTDPVFSRPVLTVDAPSTATRGKALTVSGALTASVPLPAGTPLTVTRTDTESPNGTSLGTTSLGADGKFSFTDTPPAGGKVTYTVTYAGDATHTSATASDTVEVSRTATTVTLNNDGKVYGYGKDVTFTAHLGSTYRNRTVEIWADPFGSDKPNKLVKSGTVNRDGNLSVTLRLTRDTTVTARFTGDARYQPRTATSTVHAQVQVSTSVGGHYKTKNTWGQTYYYFHKSHDPLFTTTMTAYPGRSQKLELQVYYQGTWHDAGSQYFKLSSTGVSKVRLTGTHETGYRFRVRSSYYNATSGDTVNSTTHGAWRYFLFTS